MAPRTILEDDELGSPVSSERSAAGPGPAMSRMLLAVARRRVLLGSIGIVIIAVLAWRWVASSESTPVAPSEGLDVTSVPERPLEITVLGVHDAVAAAVPAVPPQPPLAVPLPAAAPVSADPPRAAVSAPSRTTSGPRSAPGRAPGSAAAKASPLPVAATKVVPVQEPRVESVPAKPQPRPDAPPMETNPYVYK
jgi:hypothetical protein